MADDAETPPPSIPEALAALFALPPELAGGLAGGLLSEAPTLFSDPKLASQWAESLGAMQQAWTGLVPDTAPIGLFDPKPWAAMAQSWLQAMPLAQPEVQQRLLGDGMALWNAVLGQYGIGPQAADKAADRAEAPALPRSDRRFADPRWREQPFYAVVHQSYLLLAEQLTAMAEAVDGVDPAQKEQVRFATRALVEALSPANFPLTNPLVMERARETNGESLAKGLEHLAADLKRGQLTHTDPEAFQLGGNIAVTPGKVVHETRLFQLIQYTPTTETVLETPLVIFPPWINRFYILDLNPQKSFVRWAVEQGISVFMVSWKSADETLADVTWDDYVRAQVEAIDTVRARLAVPSVHAIGYCVAGTTLAATLAVLARRGEADRVKSATFFTAQVDFERAGELLNFVDDRQIAMIEQLSPQGYLDGRYMAAVFNLLRGTDLIWSYVVRNYLLGEDYPAFDLLHWNGDTTNLPVKWHTEYLRDLYRDNRMVVPDALSVDNTPVDLRRIETPLYVQAGREDHIAPPDSVWRIMDHVSGPATFVLAGSGHIAGVVNPPAAGKYQYWTNDGGAQTLEDYVAGAEEHKGSWWPHWRDWLGRQAPAEVPVKGRRRPGGRGDTVIEDAPGRYVRMP